MRLIQMNAAQLVASLNDYAVQGLRYKGGAAPPLLAKTGELRVSAAHARSADTARSRQDGPQGHSGPQHRQGAPSHRRRCTSRRWRRAPWRRCPARRPWRWTAAGSQRWPAAAAAERLRRRACRPGCAPPRPSRCWRADRRRSRRPRWTHPPRLSLVCRLLCHLLRDVGVSPLGTTRTSLDVSGSC